MGATTFSLAGLVAPIDLHSVHAQMDMSVPEDSQAGTCIYTHIDAHKTAKHSRGDKIAGLFLIPNPAVHHL